MDDAVDANLKEYRDYKASTEIKSLKGEDEFAEVMGEYVRQYAEKEGNGDLKE
jgi:hypothetical protein